MGTAAQGATAPLWEPPSICFWESRQLSGGLGHRQGLGAQQAPALLPQASSYSEPSMTVCAAVNSSFYPRGDCWKAETPEESWNPPLPTSGTQPSSSFMVSGLESTCLLSCHITLSGVSMARGTRGKDVHSLYTPNPPSPSAPGHEGAGAQKGGESSL